MPCPSPVTLTNVLLWISWKEEKIKNTFCTAFVLTRAIIIKDKNASTIVKGIIDCWVIGKGIGPGMPSKFIFDNGGEFNNADVIDLAEKYSINMHAVTAAHSPFSNGLCERNHEVVDRIMEKLLADDKKIKPEDALNHALFVKNAEPNNKGFSSFQIVYGTNQQFQIRIHPLFARKSICSSTVKYH